jgi:hypothetical protein
MKRATLMTAVAAALLSPVALADQSRWKACDTNDDKRLSQAELEQCFLKEDAVLKKMANDHEPPAEKARKVANGLAAEVIDNAPSATPSPYSTVSYADAEVWFRQRQLNIEEPRELSFGWKSLRIGRQLTDSVDPRQKEYPAAFILSYLDNRESGEDAFVALGDIRWWATELGKTSIEVQSAVDVSSGKAPSESSISLAVPVSYLALFSNTMLVDGLAAVIEPQYTTDRDFRRDVVQVTAKLQPGSKLLKAGYNTPLPEASVGVVDEFLLYWQPAFGIEAGKVNDAGGNEALAGLGSFKRLVAEVGFNLIFPKSTNLTFNASYAHRWLRDDHVERGFVTAGFQYNIAPNFALTLTYRSGRKPDTFERTNELLLGIGLMRTK